MPLAAARRQPAADPVPAAVPLVAAAPREARSRNSFLRPDPDWRARIAAREDHDVTNSYIVLGYLKPGLFRLSTVVFLLWLTDYGARHIFNRGHLARVQTIHFARWVYLNGRKRLFFASNYDGSLESLHGRFYQQSQLGIELAVQQWCRLSAHRWLIRGGRGNEQKFKYHIHRHQLPVDVWYSLSRHPPICCATAASARASKTARCRMTRSANG